MVIMSLNFYLNYNKLFFNFKFKKKVNWQRINRFFEVIKEKLLLNMKIKINSTTLHNLKLSYK